jgi:hypothetical protein
VLQSKKIQAGFLQYNPKLLAQIAEAVALSNF